ncbi:MAG: hypothetical protein ACRDKS_02070, partial [Actinomycetota bacterium]
FGPWAAFTVAHGLAGDLWQPPKGGSHIASQRDVFERLPVVLRSFGAQTTKPGNWGILLPAALVVVASTRFGAGPLPAAFLLAAAGLIAIYLLTPYDLDWHLSRSADRVVIAPLGLLALAAEGRHLARTAEPADQGMR